MTGHILSISGVPVVKHGNRSVSSACGSADVLDSLGVNLAVDPKIQAGIVETVGIAFLFAPSHHPAMRHVMAARQELGCRTVFIILGPLANPAGAQAQVIGVYNPGLTRPMAEVLKILRISHAMVVHGCGIDEITTTGETQVCELVGGSSVPTPLTRQISISLRPVWQTSVAGTHRKMPGSSARS